MSTRIRTNARAPDEKAFDDEERTVGTSPANGDQSGENEEPATNVNKKTGFAGFHHRLRGKHLSHVPTLKQSLIATARATWVNLAFIVLPFPIISYALHWDARATFVLCFLTLIPLERLLQFASHQSLLYLGTRLGDLLNITMMNIVEAILAILLLIKSELKLVQATAIGVIILQLLLVPGVSFISGGIRLISQELHTTEVQLNQTLLTMGVLSLILPAVFFIGTVPIGATDVAALVNDETRKVLLHISHGMAFIMLVVYIASRIYLIDPPGEGNALELDHTAPEAAKHKEEKLKKEQPKVSPGFCFALIIVLVVLIAVIAEFLVESIEFAREHSGIKEEWFGLILLPLVSFSGDGIVTFTYLFRKAIFHKGEPPHSLADAKPIDLAIQFTLFWIPVLILLAWIIDKPLTLLFDVYEVVVMVGACFLVNYITADAKTNWAEGVILSTFYVVVALIAWFYPGQDFIHEFTKIGHVEAVAEGHGAAGAAEEVAHHARALLMKAF